MKKTIEIPEGYEARIESNKVILEPKESEDERIRKALINKIRRMDNEEDFYADDYDADQLCTWLEKRGKQKNIQTVNDIWKDMRLEAGAQASGNRHEPLYSDNSTKLFSLNDIDEIIEKISEKQGEQNLYNFTKTCKVEPTRFRVGDTICPKGSMAEFTIESIDAENYYGKGWGLSISAEDDYELVEAKTCKDEPKFKVGDWLVHRKLVGETFYITQINKPYYYLTNLGSFIKFGEEDDYRLWTIQDAKDGYVLANNGNIGSFIKFGEEDDYRLWTIQDAKDGYVLANNGNIVLFEKVAISERQDYKYIKCYCFVLRNRLGKVFFKGGSYYLNDNFYPATKEQRNLLFQKMKEAGYEWDAEKKELKKVEQSPAWSEEDEEMLKDIIRGLNATEHLLYTHDAQGKTQIQGRIDWLKSLKEKVQPQPKQEWNEEDERIRKELLDYLMKFIPHHDSDLVRKSKVWIAWLEKRGVQTFNKWRS
jgi:hypothetical protein